MRGDVMRILYITDGFPYPLTSGRLRHFHFIRELSERHRISLFSTVPPRHPREHDAALAPFVCGIETFETHRLARGVLEKSAARLRAMVTQRPDSGMARLYRRAAELHEEEPFDVVFNAHLDCYIENYLPSVPLAYDLCDALSLRALGELRHAPASHVPAAMVKYAEALVTERSVARRAPRLILCSQRDAHWTARRTGDLWRLRVIPNGVDATYWQRTPPFLPPDRLVFVGALSARPNEDAALVLIRQVLPLVRQTVSGARLTIAGRDPSARLVRAAERERGCDLVVNASDVRPVMEEATAFVAPIRFSAGIQNKLLQAMAMAIPVVTTSSAAAGLITADGGAPPIAVERTAGHLAAATVDVLQRARHDPTPDYHARRFVEQQFRWDEQVQRIERLLLEVANVTSRPAGR